MFYKVQISTKYEKMISKFICPFYARLGTICPSYEQGYYISKYFLESKRECANDLFKKERL